MGRRDRLISRSILRVIFHPSSPSSSSDESPKPTLVTRLLAFFSLFSLNLSRYRDALFKKLRGEVWAMDEEGYVESFRSSGKKGSKGRELVAVGDLGYSGSTFFTTPNSKYLIKSLPRGFEQSFFRQRLLDPYTAHMSSSPSSLLVRITDLLYAPYPSLGATLGTAPSHHIVMENILFGKSACSAAAQERWETYDLKPNDYFYPERDVAGGALAPQSVKERLIDEFPDKIRVGQEEKEGLVAQLVQDTGILRENNAVDYSLFVVRYPASLVDAEGEIPVPPGLAEGWRAGVRSRDGRWVYRAIILDFFWARDALQAKSLSTLVRLFNWVKVGKDHGPMSITTSAEEYRSRFLDMVEGMVEVPDSTGQPAGEARGERNGEEE